jgi:hypothetical protein
VVIEIHGISGGGVGGTPVGSLGAGTLSGTSEGTSIGSGCGGISGGSGGRVGSGPGSGTRGSDIIRAGLHRSAGIPVQAAEAPSAVLDIITMKVPRACGYFGPSR